MIVLTIMVESASLLFHILETSYLASLFFLSLAKLVPPQLLPSTSFPVLYSLLIFSFDAE